MNRKSKTSMQPHSAKSKLLRKQWRLGKMAFSAEDLESERWLPVKGYEGKYEISNIGRLKRIKFCDITKPEKIIKGTITYQGYVQACIHKTIPIHALVAHAFIGDKPKGLEINHKDGIKVNNRVENLEYVTRQENIIHAIKMGLCVYGKGEDSRNVKLTTENVLEIKKLLKEKIQHKKIAKMFNVTETCISEIKRGITWGNIK